MVILLIISLLLFPLSAQAVDIKYAGCVTIQENILRDAKVIFEKKTGYSIGLSGGGAGAGIKAVLSGLVDIGGVSRPLRPDEIQQGLIPYTIGYTAVAVVVNNSVKIDNLNIRQLRDILSGKIKNWRELGAQDIPIKIVIPSRGYASRDESQRMVLGKDEFSKDAIVSPEKTISETVSNVSGSIGIVDISIVAPGKVRIVRLEGLLPEKENIKNEKYKLTIPINLVTKGQASEKVKEFIDFMLSREGQSLIEKKFIGVK